MEDIVKLELATYEGEVELGRLEKEAMTKAFLSVICRKNSGLLMTTFSSTKDAAELNIEKTIFEFARGKCLTISFYISATKNQTHALCESGG